MSVSAPLALTSGTLTGGVISASDISAAVASALVTKAASRTVAQRATDRINFADYTGADPTGQTNNATIITRALADARSQGKALYFPAGIWGYTHAVTVQQGDVILGDGPDTQFLYIGATGSGSDTRVFLAVLPGFSSPPMSGNPTVFANFRVTGPWNGTTVTTAITQSLIQVQGLWAVEFRNLVGEYSCNLGFIANNCWSVRFIECRMEHCARDALNASGSSFIQAILNQIHHCDDNAISAHSSTQQHWSMTNNAEIAFNTITDTPGISLQGVRRASISSNIIERPRQIGIEVAFVGMNLQEGETAPLGVRIVGNVITDVINRQNIDKLDTETNYIAIGTLPPQAGTAPAVPGTNLTSLKGGTVAAIRLPTSRGWVATSPFVIGATIVDQAGNVQQSSAPPGWSASASVTVGDLIVDARGNLQACTEAGTTGMTEPAWATTPGGATADGSVVWSCQVVGRYVPTSGIAPPAWASSYGALTYDGTACWQNLGANAQPAVTPPYGYLATMRANSVDKTTPVAPAMFIDISSNQCLRTIDPTANWNYSDLGFGPMFTRNGWLDPKLGSIELSQAFGISAFAFASGTILMRGVRIAGNTFHGMQVGVAIAATVIFQESEITGNNFVDFARAGVHLASPTTVPTSLLVADNLFDGDPYTLSRGGAADGTWASGISTPHAIQIDNITAGLTYERNRHRNLLGVMNGKSFPPACVVRGNIVACNPAAVGFSTSNVGIGTVPAGGPGFLHVIEDGNPADTTMGKVLNGPLLAADAMPASGTYVEGLFVWNTALGTNGGQVLLGWLRLTTGSGNVAGTDWTPVFASTS